MSTKTKVTTEIPPPTEAEKEFQRINVQLAQKQLAAIERQTAFQEQQFAAAEPGLAALAREQRIRAGLFTEEEERGFIKEDVERQKRLGPIQDELLELQLEEIRKGAGASPEEIEAIEKATGRAIEAGGLAIDESTIRGLELVREELAPSLGLRPTDTPIADRGFRLAEEGIRQKARLTSELGSVQAQAELNFPLAKQQFSSSQLGFTQNLAQSAREFQTQLRQQAFQNRLRLSGQVGAGGLGLTSGGSSAALQEALAQQRFQGAPKAQRAGLGLVQYGQLAAAGYGIYAAATAAPAACWVAEVLYGVNSVKTHTIRAFVFAHMYDQTLLGWFCRLYKKHGRNWADIVSRNRMAAFFTRIIWDGLYKLAIKEMTYA